MLAMTALFATSDALIKDLGATYSVIVLMWARYGMQMVSMGLWKAWQRWRLGVIGAFRTRHPRFQLLRAVLLLTNTGLGFASLRLLPLAEFTALVMLSPIASTILARLVLKDHVTWPRWGMVVLGFVGVLLIVRPGAGLFGWAAVLPLLMALLYASFQLLTSRLASIEDPLTTHFYTGLLATAIASVLLVAVPSNSIETLAAASVSGWAMLALIGLLGSMGHMFLILAVGTAPMSLLMPFAYTQIPFALLIGWLAFSQVPDASSMLGMVVIAFSGAATLWLSMREAARRKQPESALAADTHFD